MSIKIAIIGGGIAGLMAAITASREGAEVKLISSAPSERAQSVMAEGGINAALNTKGENDTAAEHEADTLKAACGIADKTAVQGLTREAPDLVRYLGDIGVQFNRTENGNIDLRNFGGQKKKRTAFAQSDTGKQIMTALIDETRKYESKGSIERYDNHDFETVIAENGVCGGVIIKNKFTEETEELYTDAVIVATGGFHGLFGDTTGSVFNTGEAVCELFVKGIRVQNLEMIQYHPTTVRSNGKRMLISEAARGEGGRLAVVENGKTRYFMEEKYPELGNLMPRDITARQIWREMRKSPVYLDMTGISKEVMNNKLIGLKEDCLTYLGIDPEKEYIPVLLGIHYFMGGIAVDASHRTNFANLYAAGECCSQYHGANRLGGNSLLGAAYGGKIAARTAVTEANGTEFSFPDKAKKISLRTPEKYIKMINEILLNSLGVVRNETDMLYALNKIKNIEGNMAEFAKCILKSAILRKESRGAHYREDYPETNKEFEKNTIAEFRNGSTYIYFA